MVVPAIVDAAWRRRLPPARLDSLVAASSSAWELIHSPPDLMTSLARSTICSVLSGSITAMSPVRSNRLWSSPLRVDGNTRRRSNGRDIAGVRASCRHAEPAFFIVDDAYFVAIERLALGAHRRHRSIVRQVIVRERDGCAVGCLRHAPAVADPHAVIARGMPRSWPTAAPCRRRICAGAGRPWPVSRQCSNIPSQIVGTAAAMVTPSSTISRCSHSLSARRPAAPASRRTSAPGTAPPNRCNGRIPEYRGRIVGRQAPSRCHRRWTAPTARCPDANTARPSADRSCRR